MLVFIFIAGLLLGTLLNMLIIRLPRERTLLGWPHCTRTGEPLAWWQLLPVAGWLLQRGRARNGRPLHWIHPLIELSTAVVLALLFERYGLSLTFFYLAFVCAVLIITGVIDWLHRFIYTFFVLGAAMLVLFATIVVPAMNLRDSVFGVLAAGIGFTFFFLLAKVLFPGKSAPFGLGDVYLGMFIGAAVGLQRLPLSLFYGMLLAGVAAFGIIIARALFRQRATPEYISYGTYLCIGVIAYILVTDTIVPGG